MPDDDLLSADEQQLPANVKSALIEGRKALQRTRELEGQLAERDRQAAFDKAGLADVPERKLFVEGYKGELTPEAIQAAAAEFPSLVAPVNQDLAALRRVAGAGAGAAGPNAPLDFGEAIDRAGSEAELLALLASHGAPAGLAPKGKMLRV